MYESEVNTVRESIDSLPLEIRKRFGELRGQIAARSLLPWGEHCTECNWPVCYTSCELYTPRTDGACRLFIDGMARVDLPEGINRYVLKIRFKRWGKLWTKSALKLTAVEEASRKEKSNIRTGAVARALPLPPGIKARALRKVAHWRKEAAERPATSASRPDAFMLECYNPNSRTIALTLTIRGVAAQPFQRRLPVDRGFNRLEVAFEDMAPVTQGGQPFEVEIVPNEADDTVLYFGLMDFIKRREIEAVSSAPGGKKWKCIVWDLDNTLWDGVLVEDGPSKLRLRQGVIDIIKETDQRGILHSIASKNNREEAMKFLEVCGLTEYFLHPQIGWDPKSQAIPKIAQALNIGIDSLAFVDDQPFERAEISTAFPAVDVIDAAECASLSTRAECQGPVTEESRSRRKMYRQQQEREILRETHQGDYKTFLKGCDIRIKLSSLNETNLERVYELAQRTNQMNFSGNRYPREALRRLYAEPEKKTFVIKCEDRFGSYGIVGFSVVDKAEPRLLDLMFSCRIQSKRVEHAFLAFLLNEFSSGSRTDFFSNYRKNPRNAPSGKVFDELGFETIAENEGLLNLVFRATREIPEDNIISVEVEGEAFAKGALIPEVLPT